MWFKEIQHLMWNLRMLLGALCLFPLASVYADPAELTPQDFYKGAELRIDSPSPFYTVTLSDDIYQESVKPDLRDIRVFNGSGQAVTFSLSPVEISSVEQKNTVLQIFPMQMSVEQEASESRAREKVTLKSSSGIEVNLYDSNKNQLGTTYLLQAEQGDLGLNQLVLTWDKPANNWQTKANVYSSNDLKNWRKLADKSPLMDLTSGNDRLLLNHIELDDNYRNRRAQYWLLVIDDKQSKAPAIVKAEGISITRKERTETVDLNFKAKVVSKTEVVYELARPQPLSSLWIVPEQRNTVLPINIEYRGSADGQWRTLTNTVVYQIEGENGRKTSEPLSFNDLLVQEVRIKAVSGSWGEDPPYIIGQRKRVNVIFNAQGNPPYLLVWGSSQANAATIPVEQLIPQSEIPERGLAYLPMARIISPMILGGEERLTATSPVEREALWQKWLLWGLLIAGVLILALIVFKLAREVMGNKSE